MKATIAFLFLNISVFTGVLALPWQQHLMSGHYEHLLVKVHPDRSTTIAKGQTAIDGRSLIHVATIEDSTAKQTSLVKLTGHLASTLDSSFLLKCDVELVYVNNLGNATDLFHATPYLFLEQGSRLAKLDVIYEDPDFLLIKDEMSGHTQLITRL
ncbi:hypothetical protein [Grimontia sp. NTOU-MAR1]|uniref:hypothetical protein n=1 Tax=Grimontia sp. NTOU-MAR1 TaxID=3111011 RepID=UPI002DBBC646|nr:hypothetical protein [Grimontia sp. NTOU-MAR1]WRV99674.1 hypothetical protein VP504_22040 [Grimontia sp. NTOU-MAR1]